jgi:hypothetical protein
LNDKNIFSLAPRALPSKGLGVLQAPQHVF